MLKLDLQNIQDFYVRDALRKIEQFLLVEEIMRFDFKVYEFNLKSGSNSFRHSLKYIPQDVLLTYRDVDAANIVVNFSEFTKENIVITSDVDCSVRALVGRYK